MIFRTGLFEWHSEDKVGRDIRDYACRNSSGHFWQTFLAVCDKHAQIKRKCVRFVKVPWLNDNLKQHMKERWSEEDGNNVW